LLWQIMRLGASWSCWSCGRIAMNHLPFPIRHPNLTQRQLMNFKLLLRTIFLVLILLLLVIMGMNNRQTVSLSLPPILPKAQKMPAAIMYFAFFAVGVLSGTMLIGGKKGGASGKSKAQK